MIKKICLLMILIFTIACDMPSQTAPGDVVTINDIYFEYDQESGELFIQVELMTNIEADSVRAELVTLPDMTETAAYTLSDNGENGDVIPGNDVYSSLVTPGAPIAFGIYQLRVHVHTAAETVSRNVSLVIEEQFAPQIIAVDVPDVYSIHPTEWTELHLSVTIDDANGRDDIKYVRYQVNTDFLTIDCEGNFDPNGDEDHYQSDPTWQMNYSQTTEDGYLVYDTNIPMRPVDDGEGGCGKTGIAFFQFVAMDNSNASDIYTGALLEIVACGDGECQDGAENANTCPEDCE